jgi:hypothetical protein
MCDIFVDVNKAKTHKAMAKAGTRKAKAKTKAGTRKAKAGTLRSKAKATKDWPEASPRPRPRP